MDEQPAPKPPRFNVEVPADLEASYANLVLVSHSASEIILDFSQILPNKPKAKVHSRIVMTPLHAKLLLRALAENLQRFEAKNGEIKVPTNIVIDPSKGFTS
ncbi:MAG TPA: DUF3467 domain-containing protein [Anaerolineae bacterium]|nr:DUF3467 domain-containing protein [Anaerolineae bacterium]